MAINLRALVTSPSMPIGTVRCHKLSCAACGRDLRGLRPSTVGILDTVQYRRCQYEGLVHSIIEIRTRPGASREYHVSPLGYFWNEDASYAIQLAKRDKIRAARAAKRTCTTSHRQVDGGIACADCGLLVFDSTTTSTPRS